MSTDTDFLDEFRESVSSFAAEHLAPDTVRNDPAVLTAYLGTA